MKAAASLTGSLLARKGAAYPASYSAPSSAPTESSAAPTGNRAYNDPRVIASAPPAAAPVDDAPQMQDGRFVEDFTPAAPAAPVASGPSDARDVGAVADASGAELPQAMDKMGRVRLSVRLDPDRYLRVKMASARTRWSAQDIVIAALDKYLDGSAAKSAVGGQGGGDRDDGEMN